MKSRIGVILGLAACLLVTSAHAQSSSGNSMFARGMTIDEIAVIFARYDIALEKTGVTSATAGDFFSVDGFFCTGDRCTEYLMSVGFDLPNGFPLDKINEWNAGAIGGRAYLDEENDPWLDHVISVSGPGDAGAFEEGLKLWFDALVLFDEFLDQNLSMV